MFRVVTWCIYAVLFAALYSLAVRDSANLGYPSALVGLSAVSAALSSCGVIAHALRLQGVRVRQLARVVFLIFVLDVVVGSFMDAVKPGDYNFRTAGLVWLGNLAFILFLFSPAFYANYRLAYGPTDRPEAARK